MDRFVSVPMTLSNPNPGFVVTVYVEVQYLKYLRDKVTIEHL